MQDLSDEMIKERTNSVLAEDGKFRFRNYLVVTLNLIKVPDLNLIKNLKGKDLLLYNRWPWHVLFWTGYVLFRFWLYFITINYYPQVFLEYMLLSEILFVGFTYLTIWLYKRLFEKKKYLIYFLLGGTSWILYLCARTAFQLYYLKSVPAFKTSAFADIFLNNITVVIVSFLFITACKYFKDGYIMQHFDAEKKQQQLTAEINNLKSQIAPHFLFNTLNNLYGLAVEKSDKLPHLMLRLSDLLRHSLYETQKPVVPLNDEIGVLNSYIELERIRLEDNLKLSFENLIPDLTPHQIAPLILIVFIENAFKHAKLVEREPVSIYIRTTLEDDWFELILKNNYNRDKNNSPNGIGLTNVIRRLEVLYPNNQHKLIIEKIDSLYTINLRLKLAKTI